MPPERPASTHPFFIEGGAGRIEVWTHAPTGEPRAAALCFHPHPMFGGNLHNKVLYTARSVLVERGVLCYSMNFRGVGLSAGEHDAGGGELLDAARLWTHVRESHPALPLWGLGYSFGVWIALRLAAQRLLERLYCVGLPVTVYDFSFLKDLQAPIHVFQGEWDEMGSPDELGKFFAEGFPRLDVTMVPQADHFFNGALPALREALRRHPSWPML
jgi:uncharacterized protein